MIHILQIVLIEEEDVCVLFILVERDCKEKIVNNIQSFFCRKNKLTRKRIGNIDFFARLIAAQQYADNAANTSQFRCAIEMIHDGQQHQRMNDHLKRNLFRINIFTISTHICHRQILLHRAFAMRTRRRHNGRQFRRRRRRLVDFFLFIRHICRVSVFAKFCFFTRTF